MCGRREGKSEHAFVSPAAAVNQTDSWIQSLLGLSPPRQRACDAQVLATLRRELFRTLLLQRIDFFDRHDPAELTALISNELDSLRSLVFK